MFSTSLDCLTINQFIWGIQSTIDYGSNEFGLRSRTWEMWGWTEHPRRKGLARAKTVCSQWNEKEGQEAISIPMQNNSVPRPSVLLAGHFIEGLTGTRNLPICHLRLKIFQSRKPRVPIKTSWLANRRVAETLGFKKFWPALESVNLNVI